MKLSEGLHQLCLCTLGPGFAQPCPLGTRSLEQEVWLWRKCPNNERTPVVCEEWGKDDQAEGMQCAGWGWGTFEGLTAPEGLPQGGEAWASGGRDGP